jgi:hypothetical protein
VQLRKIPNATNSTGSMFDCPNFLYFAICTLFAAIPVHLNLFIFTQIKSCIFLLIFGCFVRVGVITRLMVLIIQRGILKEHDAPSN